MIGFIGDWKWSPFGDRFIASGAQPKHLESAKPNPAIRKLLDDLHDSAFVMVAVPNERLRRMYKRARTANSKKESEFEKLGADMLTGHSETQAVSLNWYKSVLGADVARDGHRLELVYGPAKLAAIVQAFIKSP